MSSLSHFSGDLPNPGIELRSPALQADALPSELQGKSESEVTQLCLTLYDFMDCSLPGSSVHGIFQARILEWVATALQMLEQLSAIPYRRGFPSGSDGKASACNAGDLSSIPGSGRSPGEGNGNPLQYSCLKNSMESRSLAGHSPWGRKESNVTEWLTHFHVY